jgi:hypothetical protein
MPGEVCSVVNFVFPLTFAPVRNASRSDAGGSLREILDFIRVDSQLVTP